MMLRRFALVSGLAVLSAVAFAPKASANPDTQIIEFNGEIAKTCNIELLGNGQLDQDNVQASRLVTTMSGGAEVTCNGASTLSVSAPQLQPTSTAIANGFTAAAGSEVAVASGGSFNQTISDTPPSPLDRGVTHTVIVEMEAQTADGLALPPGTYEYQVTLTATPN